MGLALDFATRHAEQIRGIIILSGPSDSAQRAVIARSPHIGVLAAASVEEGAGGANVEQVIKASKSKASRMVLLKGAGHGTDIFKGSASFEATALDWLAGRLSLERRE